MALVLKMSWNFQNLLGVLLLPTNISLRQSPLSQPATISSKDILAQRKRSLLKVFWVRQEFAFHHCMYYNETCKAEPLQTVRP